MRLNELSDPELDYDELARRFSFYRLQCKGYRQRANICDRLKSCSPVISVRNSGRSERYYLDVMARSSPSTFKTIEEAGLSELSSKDSVTISEMSPRNLSQSVLLQLMISSLSKNELDNGPSNASGSFFLIVEEKLNHAKDMVTEIVALEFSVIERDYMGNGSPCCYASLHVRTFTNYKLKGYIRFTDKNPPESYPRYVKDGPCLRRQVPGDEGDAFILRRIGNKKSTVRYFSFNDYDKMSKSKVWFLSEIQEAFNLKYLGLAKLRFRDVPVSESLRPSRSKMSSDYERHVDAVLRDKPVTIINTLGEDGMEIKNSISDRFKARGYCVKDGAIQSFDCFVVKIVHNRAFYLQNGLPDPHSPASYCSLQHVTCEDFNNTKSAIDVVATSLAIKADVNAQKITLADWTFGNLAFAIKLDDKNDLDVEYALMEVDPIGRLSFSRIIAKNSDNFRLGTAMMLKDAVGAVVRGRDVNVIRETDIITVPDIKAIRAHMKKNEAEGRGLRDGIRNEFGRTNLIEEMIDINCIPLSEKRLLYSVGDVGSGVTDTLERAVNVRLVEAWEGSVLFFEDLMELLDVYFVRHKQLTVLPYPFKYLREWCYINGLLDDDDESELMDDPEEEE